MLLLGSQNPKTNFDKVLISLSAHSFSSPGEGGSGGDVDGGGGGGVLIDGQGPDRGACTYDVCKIFWDFLTPAFNN